MFKKLLFSTTLTVLAATVAFSQVQSTTKGSSSSSSKTSVSKGDRELISSGTIVNAELMNSIDVRKSKVGDEVLLKTTKAIKENGDTVVTKGATLVGRITEIQQRTKDNAQSRVGMVIDRIQGKDWNAPISVSILSMTTARASAATNDAFADAGLMSSSSGSVQSGSSGGGGGGLLGGVGNTVGGVVNTATQATGNVVGGVTQTATSTVGGVTQTAGNTVGGVGRTVNGIQISQAMGGSASGSTNFSAQHKDVRIEKGATFNVQFNNSVSN
jgi:hypothetical protein